MTWMTNRINDVWCLFASSVNLQFLCFSALNSFRWQKYYGDSQCFMDILDQDLVFSLMKRIHAHVELPKCSDMVVQTYNCYIYIYCNYYIKYLYCPSYVGLCRQKSRLNCTPNFINNCFIEAKWKHLLLMLKYCTTTLQFLSTDNEN